MKYQMAERIFNEPHQSSLNPATVTLDTKGERVYIIQLYGVYSINFMAVYTEHKRAYKECLEN